MMKENYCTMEIAIFQDTSHKKKDITDPLTYINGNKMHRVHKIQGADDYFSKNGHVNFQNICLQRLCWHSRSCNSFLNNVIQAKSFFSKNYKQKLYHVKCYNGKWKQKFY